MSDISKNGNAIWENSRFTPPDDAVLAHVRRKMRYCDRVNAVVWNKNQKPYNTSRDGLPGTLRKDGYRYVKIGKSLVPMSRIAYYLIHNRWPKGAIRFIDGDPANFAADNLFDNGDQDNPFTVATLQKIEEATQAARALKWDIEAAHRQAEDGLFYLRYERDQKIANEIRRMDEYAASSIAVLLGRSTPEAERPAQAAKTCDNRYAPRDSVDRQLKRLGVPAPTDRAEAFRLLVALS